MKIEHIIENIICIPSKFHREGNLSMMSLLRDTGYFESFNQITKKNIKEILQFHKDCVEDWINLSQNKRSDSGWYFISEEDKYIVGYYSETNKFILSEYDDKLDACAEYIKREIEELRNL